MNGYYVISSGFLGCLPDNQSESEIIRNYSNDVYDGGGSPVSVIPKSIPNVQCRSAHKCHYCKLARVSGGLEQNRFGFMT